MGPFVCAVISSSYRFVKMNSGAGVQRVFTVSVFCAKTRDNLLPPDC